MINVKPTLGGLATALTQLLVNGADPNAEVMLTAFEDVETGQVGIEIFDGMLETETIEEAESMGARTRLRVVLSRSPDYEVRDELAKELPPLPPFSPEFFRKRVVLEDVLAELDAFEVPADLKGEFAAVGVRLAKEHLEKKVWR